MPTALMFVYPGYFYRYFVPTGHKKQTQIEFKTLARSVGPRRKTRQNPLRPLRLCGAILTQEPNHRKDAKSAKESRNPGGTDNLRLFPSIHVNSCLLV